MKKILSIALLACALAFNSCVEDAPYPYATISTVTNTVAYSQADEVTVEATVSALVEVTEATLYYATDGKTFKSVPMTKSGKSYTGVIPGQPKDTEVTYYVTVVTEAGKETKSSTQSYVVGKAPVDYTGLQLNEINGNDKFIELYNAGDHDIYMGGVVIQKDGSAKWSGIEKNLKKGEYLLLYSTDVQASHDTHPTDQFFDGGLSAKKAVCVTLVKPDGSVIEEFNLATCVKTAPASYSKTAGKWYHDKATPGTKNNDDTSDPVEGLK